MYKYVHGETYTATKVAQPVSGTGFVDIVGSDGVTPIAYTAIALFDDALGTTSLVIDVDYEVGAADARYTALEGSTVYRMVRIINAAYQSAVFYADFDAVGGYVTRETFLDGDNTYSGDNTFSASAIFTGNMLVSGSSLFTGVSPQTASAWVNFDGTTNTGGLCTIRDDYNVDSITDNGTGDYTVNFDVDLDNANYSVCLTGGKYADAPHASIPAARVYTTSTVRINFYDVATNVLDTAAINVQIFGGKA